MSDRTSIIFGQPWFGREEEEAVLDTLRSGWIGQGPVVHEFERGLAEYLGADHVVAVSSCTAALHLSLVATGVGPGAEVVTSPFTFVATINAIEHTGASPVLVDIDRATLNIQPSAVSEAITDATIAVVPVHFGGRALDAHGFASLAERNRIWVIEDAAHAIGAIDDGVAVGHCLHDHAAVCFSFYPNKNLASAEGGAIATSNRELAEHLQMLRLHGLSGDAWSRYRDAEYRPSVARMAGFKYNWTDLQAAIGVVQLERLEGFLATREYLAGRYDELLADTPGISLLERPATSLSTRHALHLYQVAIDAPPPARDRVVRALRRRGIGAAVHYVGINRHPLYEQRFAAVELPVSDWASDHLLTLPLHVHLHESHVLEVSRSLREVIALTE